MSFNTALAACWDICQRNCQSAFSTEISRAMSGFYETYPLSGAYTQRSLPPEPYQGNHKVSQVIEEEERTIYHVQVGLVSVESKLVNSFLGLPFALLESLAFLTALIYQPLLLSILCVIFTPIVMLISPFMLFVDPATALLLFISPIIGVLLVIVLTVYNALQIPYRLLKSLAKIPIGVGIGIWALVQLARGQSVNPPNIQELRSGMVDQDINLSMRFDDISFVNRNNDFAKRIVKCKNNNELDLPTRYRSVISLDILEPVMLESGQVYGKTDVPNLTGKPDSITPQIINGDQTIQLPSYMAEVNALVTAMETEAEQATSSGNDPNYAPILKQMRQHDELANLLYEKINTNQLQDMLTLKVDGESYQFTITPKIMNDTFTLVAPIVGKISPVPLSPSQNQAILTFQNAKRSNHKHKNLLVVALKETLLATQNLAGRFDLLSSPQASSIPSSTHSTLFDRATSVGKTFLPVTALF